MAKKAPKVEVPIDKRAEELITRLRGQVESLSDEKSELETQLRAASERKKKPPRKFETEKIRVNGFVITVAGKDCDEDEAWIERVGDVVVILTGRAADARRNGETVGVVASPSLSHVGRQQVSDGSWTNLTPQMGASPVGLGPSGHVSDEEKARLMAINPLEQMEHSIIASGGKGIH